jgi:hypothetical protein
MFESAQDIQPISEDEDGGSMTEVGGSWFEVRGLRFVV